MFDTTNDRPPGGRGTARSYWPNTRCPSAPSTVPACTPISSGPIMPSTWLAIAALPGASSAGSPGISIPIPGMPGSAGKPSPCSSLSEFVRRPAIGSITSLSDAMLASTH